MNKLCSVFIFVVALILYSSCKTTNSSLTEGRDLQVINASYTKIYPGAEGEAITIKLTVNFKITENEWDADSVLFKGNYVIPKVYDLNLNRNISVVISADSAGKNNFDDIETDNNSAIIFYTRNNKKHFYHLKNIKENPSLYLP